MSILKEFHYSNVFQRKILYINIFLSFLLVGYIFSEITISLTTYFLYFSVIKMTAVMLLIGIFIGNLLGKGLFTRIRHYRPLYIIAEIFFIIAVVAYLIRKIVFPGSGEPLLRFFQFWNFSIPLFVFLLGFVTGFKVCYFLRISCADFIDYKQAIKKFIPLVLSGLSLGLIISSLYVVAGYTSAFLAFIVLGIIISVFILNLPFEPQLKYAQDFGENVEQTVPPTDKAPLIFTYLNFSYIILYVFLGYATVGRFYGNWFYVKLLFLCLSSIIMLSGYIAGKVCKFKNCYIYSELFFPVLFLPSIFLLFVFNKSLSFYQGMLLFLPSIFFFGITLNRSIHNIIINYKNKERYVILDFSVFILPVPILVSLSFINFTNLWFFILLYLLVFVNVLFPGIYILNRNSRSMHKILYFIFSLLVIPLLIFINMYFSIPFNNKLYNSKIENFEDLKNINYNAIFQKQQASVKMNNFPVFESNDTIIRNYKRALVPLFLYHQNKKLLFIDDTQKFFKNPFIGLFGNSTQLDPIPDKMVDYNTLPFSGNQTYIVKQKDLLFFLNRKNNYFIITDILNILDQNVYAYKFSNEYYGLVKQHLQDKGIYVQVFDIVHCRQELLAQGLKNLKNSFKSHISFLFSNILVIMSSDDPEAFFITDKNIAALKKAFENYNAILDVFSNEMQVFSHVLYLDINKLIEVYPEKPLGKYYFLHKFRKNAFDEKMIDIYAKDNNRILELIKKTGPDYFLWEGVRSNILNNDKILTLLKMTELTEINQDYVNETKYLFELKKYFDYKVDLRKYLSTIMSIKKEYYYDAALKLEKEKKWQKAKLLYEAILEIDKDNFRANYRMGILCITLQQIDESFKYLKEAMRLEQNHPEVLFHMGVLYFSRGKTNEAIDYFNQSLVHKGKSAAIHHYLGMAYEKLGNIPQAEQCYNQAFLLDPNDENIKNSIKNINDLKVKERDKWKMYDPKNQNDEEIGIDIPLPINKTAIDMRLKDDDKN